MTIATLLLDPNYGGLYIAIGMVPCIFLVILELVFTNLYVNKNKIIYFILFLLPSCVTALYAFALIGSNEQPFIGLGVASFIAMFMMLLINIAHIFKKK
ncbi:hypothetical protein K3G63_22445 [Hymenobacter sp. HSC-4F20]|uniref:hypothetical protein n=1 Tax=Hymenobacter sp. HSC-4F20 TaxID=2864135 RepID=UPI001C72C7FA|nr:hypothetical protein [Hymenobacter sp. HSC-4F20]MBX0293222.1 hypothetical protein [Hymenobacter sp. HSC-4F20]